jgi:hypothetical protein
MEVSQNETTDSACSFAVYLDFARKALYGNGDGLVGLDEIRRHLDDKVTYLARRYYDRQQTVQIVKGTAR